MGEPRSCHDAARGGEAPTGWCTCHDHLRIPNDPWSYRGSAVLSRCGRRWLSSGIEVASLKRRGRMHRLFVLEAYQNSIHGVMCLHDGDGFL